MSLDLMPTPGAPAPARAARRLLRRGVWEPITLGLIATGLLLLMQPFSLELFGWSFVVLLSGVAGYTVAGKLPV